jgi:hypothetical protein
MGTGDEFATGTAEACECISLVIDQRFVSGWKLERVDS